jgi:hypothetical protein
MKLVDVNILLYAVNEESAHHQLVRVVLENAINGDEPVGMAWVVLLAFLRLSTHPRAFARPLDPDAAMAIVDAWLAHPNVRIITERDQHWPILRGFLAQAGTAGNVTTDAHLAALAIERGAVLISCDADFSRFRELRWENPLARGKQCRK